MLSVACRSNLKGCVLTFNLDLIPFSVNQKISTLASKTCKTLETAFRLRLKHRYCFTAKTNGVASLLDEEKMSELGDMKRGM